MWLISGTWLAQKGMSLRQKAVDPPNMWNDLCRICSFDISYNSDNCALARFLIPPTVLYNIRYKVDLMEINQL